MKNFKKPVKVKNTGTTDALRQLRAEEFERSLNNKLKESRENRRGANRL